MLLPEPWAVCSELKAGTAEELIQELGARLEGCPHVRDHQRFILDLLARERDTPTGLEHGCALPHARSAEVDDIVMLVGRSRQGVDFGAPDGPAHLFFLFGVPLRAITPYLKLVARLSGLLRAESYREALLAAEGDAEFLRCVRTGL
ncbi:MAG: PTS sugar transporter subunit IIA [Calditrichaeota bacterium]|nr:PTS sugar transporter subunit IIA [Candidatus Cloacimonadota bacterium]MCA9785871.1 PTS sugar transporter subunit IIA [Candidatus Cloacimonadota bacterium]MCB1047068.1 PTS sugar transporter subunit IIA [Calditrichota bacterium]MCB9474792.1 PTS sugar transporter subunit IIA [Candidatus Delongbacteria bacterium]